MNFYSYTKNVYTNMCDKTTNVNMWQEKNVYNDINMV